MTSFLEKVLRYQLLHFSKKSLLSLYLASNKGFKYSDTQRLFSSDHRIFAILFGVC